MLPAIQVFGSIYTLCTVLYCTYMWCNSIVPKKISSVTTFTKTKTKKRHPHRVQHKGIKPIHPSIHSNHISSIFLSCSFCQEDCPRFLNFFAWVGIGRVASFVTLFLWLRFLLLWWWQCLPNPPPPRPVTTTITIRIPIRRRRRRRHRLPYRWFIEPLPIKPLTRLVAQPHHSGLTMRNPYWPNYHDI